MLSFLTLRIAEDMGTELFLGIGEPWSGCFLIVSGLEF